MLGRILVFIGGLLVLLLSAALLVPYFVDWGHFRQEFETQASRALGKKVEVTGDVDVRFLPFPSVTLHDVQVGRTPEGVPLATASAFSMDAELAPLLSGEMRIFKMELEDPVVNLSLDENGTFVWTKTGNPGLATRKVVFEDVVVHNGTIHLNDAGSGRSRTVSGIDAQLSANAIEGPWRMQGQASLDGHAGRFTILTGAPDVEARSVRLRIGVDPEAWPVSATLEGALALEDKTPVYAGDFRLNFLSPDGEDNSDATPPPRLSGNFKLTNQLVEVPDYRLEIGTRVDPYVVTGEGSFDTRPEGRFLLTANGQQFNVERLADYAVDVKKGRVSSASARTRLDQMLDMVRRIPVPDLPGQVTFRLPAVVAGDTTIRDVVLDASPEQGGWQITSGSAVLPGRTQVEASGTLVLREGAEARFDGSLLVASRQPSGLSKWLTGDVSPEIRSLDRAGFSADVTLERGEQSFENLEVVAGDAVLHGALSRLSAEGSIPSLNLNLEGNVVDYATLKALAGLMTGEDQAAGLAGHRLAVQLKAGVLNAFDLTARDVDTQFSFNDGAIALSRLDIGDLAGAAITLSGQGQVGDGKAPTGAATLHLTADDISGFIAMLEKRFQAHPLLAMLEQNALWYRNADLTADLTFGQDGRGGAAVFRGSANDSKLAGSWRMEDLAPDGGMSGQLQISNPDAAILFGQAGLSPLPIPAPDGAQASISVEKTGGAQNAAVSLRVNSGETRLTASGNASLGAGDFLNGGFDLSLSSPDLEPYLAMNAVAIPGTAFGIPLSLKARLDITGDQYAFSGINAAFENNSLTGQLNFARHQPVPRLSGAVSVDTLDLAWLMEAAFGPGFTMTDEGLSAEPFGTAYFGTAEADVDVQAGRFETGLSEPVSAMRGKVNFRGGSVAVADLGGRWFGGTLSGEMRFGSSDGNGYFQSRIDLKDGVLPENIWVSDGAPVLSGTFDLGMVTESTAKTAAGLIAHASGSGLAVLKNPTVNGLNLSLAGPLLDWADGQGTGITNDAIAEEVEGLLFEPAGFSAGDISIPFSISDGVLQARNVLVDLPQARIFGAIRTDLSTLSTDASLAADLKLGDQGEDGASAGFVLNFNGPLDAPARSVDLTEMNNFLSLRAVERERARVERLQSDLIEKQRLRRESTLYRYNDEQRRLERERAAAEEQRRLEEQRAAGEQATQLQGLDTEPSADPDDPSSDALIEAILKSVPTLANPDASQ